MDNIDLTDYLYTNEEMEELYRSLALQYESKYSLDELVEKTKSLNDLNFDLETNKSIAVVGNSGTLMEKEYGEFIDNHDIVIRCNHGRVEGFEKNVGSKTDFRFVSGKGFWYGKVMDETYSNYDHNFLTNLKNQRMIIKAIPMYNSLQGIIKHYNTKSNVHFLRESFIKDSETLSGVGNSTLGFTAICFAVQFSKKISIFGFGFFKEDWDKQHYFEKIKPKNRDHTFDDEEEYINFLRTENILEIFK